MELNQPLLKKLIHSVAYLRVWQVSGDPLKESLVAKSRVNTAEQILRGAHTDVFHGSEWPHGPQPSHPHTSYQAKWRGQFVHDPLTGLALAGT